ncbi:MAG: FeoA family protein [Betaproteobacteria bacterium]
MPLDVAPATVVSGLIPLSRIKVGQRATIRQVRVDPSDTEGGEIGLRLLELGFVEGELLRVIAHGYPGNEPIAVRIGNTTFALRRFEADHVLVMPVSHDGAAS